MSHRLCDAEILLAVSQSQHKMADNMSAAPSVQNERAPFAHHFQWPPYDGVSKFVGRIAVAVARECGMICQVRRVGSYRDGLPFGG